MGSGCFSGEQYSRYTPYEAPYSDPFYYNDTYATQPFELTLPEGWYSTEEPAANIIIMVGGDDADHITVQVFTQEDPTDLIKAHMSEVSVHSADVGDYSGTELTGYGEGLYEESGVTHTILETEAGWFVFSSDKHNQNYTDVMNSLKF